jgi:hypothetical protein
MWVSWKVEEHHMTSRVLNLSASGALIDSQQSVAVGTQLQLLFATKEGQLKLQAVARNFQPGTGLGVEFVSMRARELQLVLKVVKRLFAVGISKVRQ